MTTLTVTAKGQVTLRKEILQHLGVAPGDRITVEKLPDGRIEIGAERPKGDIRAAYGFLRQPGRKPVSIDEMNQTIEKGWAGKL